jgi:hypothetical protein
MRGGGKPNDPLRWAMSRESATLIHFSALARSAPRVHLIRSNWANRDGLPLPDLYRDGFRFENVVHRWLASVGFPVVGERLLICAGGVGRISERAHDRCVTDLKTIRGGQDRPPATVARIAAACIMALSLCAPVAHAQNDAKAPAREKQNACTYAALTDYNKQNLALLQQGTPIPSVDAMIAIRRLEEDFCRRFVQCVLEDQNTLHFRSAFAPA